MAVYALSPTSDDNPKESSCGFENGASAQNHFGF
jgi:hypothetical protein